MEFLLILTRWAKQPKLFPFFVGKQRMDMLQSLKPIAPEGAVPPALLYALPDDPKFALWHRRRESWSQVSNYRATASELGGRLAYTLRLGYCILMWKVTNFEHLAQNLNEIQTKGRVSTKFLLQQDISLGCSFLCKQQDSLLEHGLMFASTQQWQPSTAITFFCPAHIFPCIFKDSLHRSLIGYDPSSKHCWNPQIMPSSLTWFCLEV